MAWLLRNWALKLGALALAMVLYTGLVFSGSFTERTFPGVPVATLNQPDGTYVLTQQLGSVDIRYRIAADATGGVTAESFAVTIDLAAYDNFLSGKLQDFEYPDEEVAKSMAALPKVG